MKSDQASTPSSQVPALAAVLASEHFPNGERAALKRMALDGPAPLAFHRFMLRHVDEKWQDEFRQADWRALTCSLALQRDGGFDPARSLGQALAEAGFSESRLERLLAARDDTLRTLALRAARQLAAKGLKADWRQMADLLFYRQDDVRESVNRRIARDYYRTTQTKDQED